MRFMYFLGKLFLTSRFAKTAMQKICNCMFADSGSEGGILQIINFIPFIRLVAFFGNFFWQADLHNL